MGMHSTGEYAAVNGGGGNLTWEALSERQQWQLRDLGFTRDGVDTIGNITEQTYYGVERVEFASGSYAIGDDISNAYRLIEELNTLPTGEGLASGFVEQRKRAREACELSLEILRKYCGPEWGASTRRKNGPTESDYDRSYLGHGLRAMAIVVNEFRIYDPEVIMTAALHDMFNILDKVPDPDRREVGVAFVEDMRELGERLEFSKGFMHTVIGNLNIFQSLDAHYSELARRVAADPEINALLREAGELQDSAFALLQGGGSLSLQSLIVGLRPEQYKQIQTIIAKRFVNNFPTAAEGEPAFAGSTIGGTAYSTFKFENGKYLNYFQLAQQVAINRMPDLQNRGAGLPTADFDIAEIIAAEREDNTVGSLPVMVAMAAQAVDNSRYPREEVENVNCVSDCTYEEMQARIYDIYFARARDSFDVIANLLPVAQLLNNQYLVRQLQNVALQPFFPQTIHHLEQVRLENNMLLARYFKLNNLPPYFAEAIDAARRLFAESEDAISRKRDPFLEYNLKAARAGLAEAVQQELAELGLGETAREVSIWEFTIRKIVYHLGVLSTIPLLGQHEYVIYGNTKTVASEVEKLCKIMYDYCGALAAGEQPELERYLDVSSFSDLRELYERSNDPVRFTVVMGRGLSEAVENRGTWERLQNRWRFNDEPISAARETNHLNPIRRSGSIRDAALEAKIVDGKPTFPWHVIFQARTNREGRLPSLPIELHVKSLESFWDDDLPHPHSPNPLRQHASYKAKHLWHDLMQVVKEKFAEVEEQGNWKDIDNLDQAMGPMWMLLGSLLNRIHRNDLLVNYNGSIPERFAAVRAETMKRVPYRQEEV